jgi:uncharacterized protein DUF4129
VGRISREGTLAAAGAAAVCAVVAGLVVLASSSGSVRPISESTKTVERTGPTPPVTASPTVPTFGSGDEVVGQLPEWVWSVVRSLMIIGAVLVAILIARAVIKLVRSIRIPEIPRPEPENWQQITAIRVAEAVDDSLAQLATGPASDAIVACWVALERAAEQAGMPREASETPAEFTVRVLAGAAVSEPELMRLAALYREARFSSHTLPEEARAEARAALEVLRDQLEVRA